LDEGRPPGFQGFLFLHIVPLFKHASLKKVCKLSEESHFKN
jgi:hypothetical protein